MNGPVHLPTPYHRFSQNEVARMSRAGILPSIEAVEVRDGRPVEGARSGRSGSPWTTSGG